MNRRLLLLVLITSLFAIGVLIWYFFFVTPKSEPSIQGTSSPLFSFSLPARFGFIQGNGDTEQNSTTTTEVTPPIDQPLINVWDKPTTGNVFITRSILKEIDATSTLSKSTSTIVTVKKTIRATSTILMFVDRTTGHIYEHTIETGVTHQISNTTVPGVYDAYIFNNGTRVLLRYVDTDRTTIISVIASIPNVGETGNPIPLESLSYLPKNITSVAVNASTNKISYLTPTGEGSSIYTITTKGQTLTALSPFSEWSLSYGGDQLYATNKASAYVEGTTVLLPSFTRLIGNKTGLLSNPSSDGTFINSMLSNSGLISFIFSNKGISIPLSIKTLASKCVWGKGTFLVCAVPHTIPQQIEGLPDDWYQGRAQFSDSLSFVDTKDGSSYSLYSFDPTEGGMDVTHMTLSHDNILLSFIRKQDSGLWLLKTNLLE